MSKDEKLYLKLKEPQEVHMKVGAQIIEHLSKGIYSNPARAIKELISNAFDADATKVIVRARPELDTFTITDNGTGMNYKDFDDRFLFLSRSDRRDESNYSTVYGRPIIGKFGIGFVAVSQICDNMTVISSKKSDPFKMEAHIDFSKFRKIEHKAKDIYELSDVVLTNYEEEEDAHYTIVDLSKLTDGFRKHLEDKDRVEAGIRTPNLDGQSFEGILNQIWDQANTYRSGFVISKNLGRYWQMLYEIANTVPVRYLDAGPLKATIVSRLSKENASIIKTIARDVENLDFTVEFDGIYLRKPILFPIDERISRRAKSSDVFVFSERFEFDDKTLLKFRGYIYNQESSIYPPEMRGIMIWIKNTAIGGPDPDFMDYLFGEKLFQQWTFGEIYVDDGLEDALNINRSTFNTAHPHYQGLRSYLHSLLHNVVFTRSRQRSEKRREGEDRKRFAERRKRMENRLFKTLGRKVFVRWSSAESEEPISFDKKSGIIRIYTKHSIFRKLRRKEVSLVQSVLVLLLESYEMSDGDAEDLVSYFLRSLDDWDFRR
jgi:hypothetical protein